MPRKKITAGDVAERAGVSRAAVSMILNQYPDIHFSEETRARVLSACRELGYKVPEKKLLVPTGRRVLLAVCPSCENYAYSRMLGEVQLQAKKQDYYVLSIHTFRDMSTEAAIPELCASMSVAGVIFLYNPRNSEMVKTLVKQLPVVQVYDKGADPGQNVVETDNVLVGELMATHLLKLGHRHIATTFPSLGASHIGRKRRIEGVKNAYRKAGMDPDQYVHVCCADQEDDMIAGRGDNSYDSGYRIAGRLVDEKAPVTAFLANNDMAAYGIMDAIYERGKRIPEDYSVIGCDNIAVSGFQRVSLTTVEPYSVPRVREAVNIVVRKIEHRADEETMEATPEGVIRVTYAPRLIERGSTGPVANH